MLRDNHTLPRLPWRRAADGHIVAQPEDHRPDRLAEIRYDSTSSTKWHWLIRYDLATASGHAATSQGAADAATEAWPQAKAEAARLGAAAAAADALRTLVNRQCDKGDLPLSAFEIEASSGDRLRKIIWLIQDRRGLTGPARGLVEACSAELGARRVRGDDR